MKTKKQSKSVLKEIGVRGTPEQVAIINKGAELFCKDLGLGSAVRKRNFFVMSAALKASNELIKKAEQK